MLTDLNRGLLDRRALATLRSFSAKSSFDGLMIDGWMLLPPNYDPQQKYPVILEVHGGPYSSYGPNLSTEFQLYVTAGYVVVYANPRGSTSYGEKFANYIYHANSGHDYDDLMSVVDAAIAIGPVDPHNLFVKGASGGGTLTAWIVGKTSRFNAAVVQKPVINWTSELLTTDSYTEMGKYWFGKMPWEDPEGAWRRSPISLVGNVTTPTALLVGEDDLRTPTSEATQFYAALRLRSVPTVLILVPGASHGSLAARPSHYAAEVEALLGWFERYRIPPAAIAATR